MKKIVNFIKEHWYPLFFLLMVGLMTAFCYHIATLVYYELSMVPGNHLVFVGISLLFSLGVVGAIFAMFMPPLGKQSTHRSGRRNNTS